jgi:serpin B
MVGAMRRTLISGSVAGIAVLLAMTLPQRAAAQDARIKILVEAYNASGQRLFKTFAAAPGNVVFSPYSIGAAMAMVLSGARGENATEMAKVLREHLPRADMDAANGSLLATLNGYDRSAVQPTCPDTMRWSGVQCESAPAADGACRLPARREGDHCAANPTRRTPSAQLRIANALVQGTTRNIVAKDYQTLLADKYAAEVLRVADVSEVNDWVKRKTEGKIEKIIDQLSDVTLLNAIYFKARWMSTFSKDSTRNKPFSLSSSRKRLVPMMANTDTYSMVERRGYRAIRLPYDVNELGMVIVLPNDIDGVARIGDQIDAMELSKLLDALHTAEPKSVALEMPRFKIGNKPANLTTIFRQEGMKRAFDRQKADFSGITGRPASELPFWIDEVRHGAVIEVMEDGTEAAAVTAIALRAASVPLRGPEPEPFHVDHPFLFYVVDDATSAVLFQGRITEPL